MKFDKEKFISRLKKVGIITMWLLLVSALIFSLAFVNKQADEVKCNQIIVNIKPENILLFVDREAVIKTIRGDGDEKKIIDENISSLNTSALEKKLNSNKMILRAQVFTDLNGVLTVNIIQREPILRILKQDGTGFYIDRKGSKMPLSARFTARVPIATGNIYENYSGTDSIKSFVCSELFKIATYVDKDAFWKAQIEQIFVNADNELVLIPKLGDHQIIFGSTHDMDEKFKKLMLFYKEGLGRMGWNKYKSINVSYKDQVVCVRKEKK